MNRPLRVAVCLPQVPFEHGGAEIHAETLVAQLRQHGHEADLVTVPYQWTPNRALLENALCWRLLDFTSSNGRPIDLLIGTKFPSYLARHPRKVVWLFHQFRQAYDLHGTPFAQFDDEAEGLAMRDSVRRMDEVALGEAKAIFTTSRNNAERLARFNGIDAQILPAPPQDLPLANLGDDGYILSVGRLDPAKRIDLLIQGLNHAPTATAIIVGGGSEERARLQAIADDLGVGGRVDFRGKVSQEELVRLYGRARAVFYAPHDEDYGFVTIEAHLAGKGVVTTSDAGGPLEHVEHERTGLVTAADPAAVGAALERAATSPEEMTAFGLEGQRAARLINWDTVIDTLIGSAGL